MQPIMPPRPRLQRRPFTISDFHRMGEAGILGEDERLELIDGEIIEFANPDQGAYRVEEPMDPSQPVPLPGGPPTGRSILPSCFSGPLA